MRKTKRVENTLEDADVAGDPKDSLLLVAVLSGGEGLEELNEERMVENLRADDEPLHLFSDVDRHVSRRNLRRRRRGSSPELRSKRLRPARRPTGFNLRSEDAVLRRVRNARETPYQLLHRD